MSHFSLQPSDNEDIDPTLDFGPQPDARLTDVELLKQAVLNEKLSPEILPYNEDLVQRIRDKLSQQEGNVELLESDMQNEIRRVVYKMDILRVRYLLKSYLRARLSKIERFAGLVLDTAELQTCLSPQEISYAQGYFVLWGRHMKKLVADRLPPDFQSLVTQWEQQPGKDMLAKPDTSTYVFAKVEASCGFVQINDQGEALDLMKGDVYLIKYGPLADKIRSGHVRLV